MSTILQDLEDDITSECWMIHSHPHAMDGTTFLTELPAWNNALTTTSSFGGGGDYLDNNQADDDDDVIMAATKRVSLDATATTTTCGWTTNNDNFSFRDDEDAATPFELMDVDKDPILSQTLPTSISFIETVVDQHWGESVLLLDDHITTASDSRNFLGTSFRIVSTGSSSQSNNHQNMDATSASSNHDDDDDDLDDGSDNNHEAVNDNANSSNDTSNSHWSQQFQERRRQLAISMAASQKTRQVLRLKEHVRRRANLLKVLSDIEKSSKIIQIHLYNNNDNNNNNDDNSREKYDSVNLDDGEETTKSSSSTTLKTSNQPHLQS